MQVLVCKFASVMRRISLEFPVNIVTLHNGDSDGFCGGRCLQEIQNNVETKANRSDPVVRKRQ